MNTEQSSRGSSDCDDRVLVTSREDQARARSAAQPQRRRSESVLTFREGRLLRYQEFYDEAEALEAAGLSE